MFESFIVCDNPRIKEYSHECGFFDLIELAHNLINNLVVLATFLAVAVFIFAGFKYLTSGGDSGKAKEAKGMLLLVLKGYLWILVAWLLIYTISDVLLKPGYEILGDPDPIPVDDL